MKSRPSALCRTLLAGLLIAGPVQAQSPPAPPPPGSVISIPRLSGEIELDGVVNEAAWDEIDPFPMTMYTPTFRGPLTEATEVRVGHDDRFLYVSGRMYDSEPHLVRTSTFYRDTYSGDDILAVLFDSYNDYETAVWFVTNPAGVRQDRTVSNDAQFTTGMPMNSDWNSYWDVATTQNDEGWFAEFRIPFSTLGFQTTDGKVTMGLISYRVIARKTRAPGLSGHGPQRGRPGVRQAIARAAHRVAGRATGHAPLCDPLFPRRIHSDAGAGGASGGPAGGVANRARPHDRGGHRRQVLADLEPGAGPD